MKLNKLFLSTSYQSMTDSELVHLKMSKDNGCVGYVAFFKLSSHLI